MLEQSVWSPEPWVPERVRALAQGLARSEGLGFAWSTEFVELAIVSQRVLDVGDTPICVGFSSLDGEGGPMVCSWDGGLQLYCLDLIQTP